MDAFERIRRSDDLLFGRLVQLPSSTTLELLNQWHNGGDASSVISFDFPAMPDTLELARTAEYAVHYDIVLPDGVHQYKGTAPLSIPVSFKLHAEDPFCAKGSLTLLQMASRLHSFVLPISSKEGLTVTAESRSSGTNTPGTSTAQEIMADQGQSYMLSDKTGRLYPPATCWLHMIYLNEQQPGISCVGYVKDVKVTFNGPWRRGSESEFNLPSSAEFAFTFIHRPGHGNSTGYTKSTVDQAVTTQSQAYAKTVLEHLYKTDHLALSKQYRSAAD